MDMSSPIVGKIVVGVLFVVLLIGAQWIGKAMSRSIKDSAKELNDRVPK